MPRPNAIKYSTATQSGVLRRGNFHLGITDRDYGPTINTGYYSGISFDGGYVTYIWLDDRITYNISNNDGELLSFLSTKSGQTFSGITESLIWSSTQSDMMIVNKALESLPTNGLSLYLDANFLPSYTRSGSIMFDTSPLAKTASLMNSPTYNSNGTFTLDGIDDGISVSGSIVGTSSTSTVVIWIKTTDTVWLWVRGNNNNSFYLGAINNTQRNWYNGTVGSPTFSVDLKPSTNPFAEGYLDGRYHMFEAKNVNLSSWTNHEFFFYSGFNMAGGLSKICIYNRNITSAESEQLYYQSNVVRTGLTSFIDPGNIISYEPGRTSSYSLIGTSSATLLNGTSYNNVGAFSFDGVDDYIISDSNLGISGDAEFSICYWAIWDDNIFSGNYPSGVGNNSTGTSLIGLSTTWQSGRVALDFWNNRYVATDALLVRNWYYLCFTKTPGMIATNSKIYVNGRLVTGTFSGSSPSSSPNITDSPLVIGRLDSARYFKGRISNVKIYNRALTESEIKDNFNATKWRFNIEEYPEAISFRSRVTTDSGIFESLGCLRQRLAAWYSNELYQNASIIITPNGRKVGKLYSLKPINGSGDLSVTRATNATERAADGTIVVPITNLIIRSEEINDNNWQKTNILSVTTNAISSPIGSLTADLLIPNTTNGEHNVIPLGVPLAPITGIETYSIYAKAGGYNFLGLRCNVNSTWVASFFNLSNGTISSSGASFLYTRMEDVGNGWYRCSITFQNRSANGLQTIPSSNGSVTFAGDGTSGIYLWGAQLENTAKPSEYLSTTSTTLTKFGSIIINASNINNLPRINYPVGAGCPSILSEQQSTNLLLRSQELNLWNGPATITTDTSIAPDNTLTADTINIGTTNGYRRTPFFTILNSVTYTYSIFLKNIALTAGQTFRIYVNNNQVSPNNMVINANVDLASGTITTGSSSGATSVTSRITQEANGWFRASLTFTTNSNITTTICEVGLESVIAGREFLAWGAQLEVGPSATSYIPTYSTTMTRNADEIVKTGVSSLINSVEGTIFARVRLIRPDTGTPTIFTISDGTTDNRVSIYNGIISEGRISCAVVVNNVVQVSWFSSVGNYSDWFSIAVRYKENDFAMSINGNIVNTDDSGVSFSAGVLNRIGFDNGQGGSRSMQETIFAGVIPIAYTNEQLNRITI
jgi:hypothetical protein